MLDNLLDKPEGHRRQIAFFITMVLGVFVFAVWVYISKFSVRQVFDPASYKEEAKFAENFRQSLPDLRQTETVKTELAKGAAVVKKDEAKESPAEEKSWWKMLLGID